MISAMVRALTIGLTILAAGAGVAGATTYESRAISVTKTTGGGQIVKLTGKLTSKTAPCHVGAPLQLQKLSAGGRWSSIRSSRTTTKGAFSWTFIGFKAKARIVVPQITKGSVVCAPVTLGFDRGYLSP
jgi:hypothetical protein